MYSFYILFYYVITYRLCLWLFFFYGSICVHFPLVVSFVCLFQSTQPVLQTASLLCFAPVHSCPHFFCRTVWNSFGDGKGAMHASATRDLSQIRSGPSVWMCRCPETSYKYICCLLFPIGFSPVLLLFFSFLPKKPFNMCWGRSNPRALWESFWPAFTGLTFSNELSGCVDLLLLCGRSVYCIQIWWTLTAVNCRKAKNYRQGK